MICSKIFVVETEAVVAHSICHQLTDLGYESLAYRALTEQVLLEIEKFQPALVLMNIPSVDTIDQIQAAKAICDRYGQPVIFMTAINNDSNGAIEQLAGSFGYLEKPFTARELHIAIEMGLYRHRVEGRLQASEDSLAITLQSINDAVIVIDHQEQVTRMNPTAERLTGWTWARAIGMPLKNVFQIVSVPPRPSQAVSLDQKLAPDYLMGPINPTVLLARDGTRYQIADTSTPIRNATGGITGTIIVFSDVTDQNKAQEKLRENEQRYRELFDANPHPMWVYDPTTLFFLMVNDAAVAHYGYSRAEFLSMRVMDIRPPEELPRLRNSVAQHMAVGLKQFAIWRHRKRDGTLIEVEVTSHKLTLTGRSAVVVLAHDITERKAAEAAQRSLEAQLRESQKMESIGTLAGGIAHDFNNILGGILGNLAMVREDLGAGHVAQSCLQQIEKSSLRAKRLVEQILAFSRRQPHILKRQLLRPVIEEALNLLRSTLPTLVRLSTSLTDVRLQIDADATQIHQVLMNLCTNAWHALNGHTGQIHVGLDAVTLNPPMAVRLDLPIGRYAHLWVSDSGCGMDSTTRMRIFEPFFTTKSIDKGTGLGLSVVHGIVSAHHGAITVETELDNGSTFHLYFPSKDAPCTEEENTPVPQITRGQGQHVLYVDDDEVMELMVDRLLQRLGYRVSCFSVAQQALAAVNAHPANFDLVVTDYNMPDLSGLDVARELKRIRPELPVIMVTGLITDELRASAKQIGVRSLLQKQNTLEELGPLINSVLAPMSSQSQRLGAQIDMHQAVVSDQNAANPTRS